MSYGSFALEPIGGHRVNPVLPTMASLRIGARQEGGPGARGGSVDVPATAQPRPVELPPLSATSLRAQAVGGLLEARRSDLVGAERAVGDPGAAARRSLADVWPEQDRDRPDAKAAQDVTLTRADDAAASRKRADKDRREAAVRADLITRTAADEAARAAAALADAQAERAERVERSRDRQEPTASAADPADARDGSDSAARAAQDARAQGAHAQRAAAQAASVEAEFGRQEETARSADAADARRAAEAAQAEADAAETQRSRDPRAALTDVVRAADDVRRLRTAIHDYASSVRDGIDRAVADVNDLAGRVAGLNDRISAAVDGGRPIPEDLARQREQLVVSLARLSGATAQPGPRASVDVAINGRALVTGGHSGALESVIGADGSAVVRMADGPALTPSSGVLASRLGTANGVLAALDGVSNVVLGHLGDQAVDAGGAAVDGGPAAAAALGGLLREVAHAAQSSAAYAQVAAGVENLVSRLTHGDVPAAVRGSDLMLGAVDTPAKTSAARPSAESTVGPLRAALAELGKVAAEATAPSASLPSSTVVSGAPGIATPLVAADAPAGLATVRVLSLAAGGAVGTAQSFHPDSPLGDGWETTIGIVEALGTAQEHTTVIEVGRYPTPADLASYINQSSAGVRATLNELTGGTVQLHLESLSSGRGQNITIVNGLQPPAASAILGRAVQLTAARDAMIEVQRAGHTAAVMQSATNSIRDVLPGIALDLHRADAGRAFQVGLRREAADVTDLAARLVGRAADAIGAARAAGAPDTAAGILGALGLAGPLGGTPGTPQPGASPAGAGGDADRPARGGLPGVPGLHTGRRGDPALDKRELAAALEADPAGTSSRLTGTARALSSVAANVNGATWEAYVAARAAQGPDPLGTYTPDARKTGRDDTVAVDLSRRERALLSVLTKLQDQGDWLGRQLATQPT